MKLIRFLSACCAATILLGFSGAGFANGYNDGFIAAESGDYQTAFEKWEPLAKKGDALAQFNLALLYHSGAGGVEANEQKAVSWYLKAADNGYYYAQEYMAVGYKEGWFGLKKDVKQAAYWQKRLDENQY